MRMAPCPMCGQHNVNNCKKHNKWYSVCFNKECKFITEVGMPSRKLTRFNWNLLYEKTSGEQLPDEMTGRQKTAFMKKEIKCGLPELTYCFTKEDFSKWCEEYDLSKVDWVKAKGKKYKRGTRVKFRNAAPEDKKNEQ